MLTAARSRARTRAAGHGLVYALAEQADGSALFKRKGAVVLQEGYALPCDFLYYRVARGGEGLLIHDLLAVAAYLRRAVAVFKRKFAFIIYWTGFIAEHHFRGYRVQRPVYRCGIHTADNVCDYHHYGKKCKHYRKNLPQFVFFHQKTSLRDRYV